MDWEIGIDIYTLLYGFPCSSVSKESTCNARDPGLIPGSGRSPGGAKGNPLQYSCLESPTDRGAWRATIHGATKGQTGLGAHTRHVGDSYTSYKSRGSEDCSKRKPGTIESF